MKKQRIITAIILVLVLALTALGLYNLFGRNTDDGSPLPILSKLTAPKKTYYLSLGDSIGAGYGLPSYESDGNPGEEAYYTMFSAYLGTDVSTPLAVTGDDTSDLLERLETEEYINEVTRADYITLAIGSNDILGPGLDMIYNCFSVKNAEELLAKVPTMTKLDMLSAVMSVNNKLRSADTQTAFEGYVESYKTNYDKIISKIKELNPDVKIYALNYYNPYAEFVYPAEGDTKTINIGGYIQVWIDEMNGYLAEKTADVTVVDISAVYDGKTNVYLGDLSNIFNIDTTKVKLDPHPSAEGHSYIFEKLKEAHEASKSE